MLAQIQGAQDHVIAVAADGYEVLQAAILSETQALVQVQGPGVAGSAGLCGPPGLCWSIEQRPYQARNHPGIVRDRH